MKSHSPLKAARRGVVFGFAGAALSAAFALPALAVVRQQIHGRVQAAATEPLRLVDDALTPEQQAENDAVHSFISSNHFFVVTEGSGPLILDVFFDPNCIFCHQFWTRLNRTPNWQSAFTVHWIPVAFLKPDSASKGAFILLNGPAAFEANESAFDLQAEEGAGQQSDAQNGLSAVQANTNAWTAGMNALAAKFGPEHYGTSTPTIVVGNVAMLVGSPSQSYLDNIAKMAAELVPNSPSASVSAGPTTTAGSVRASGGLTLPPAPPIRGSVAPSSQAVRLPPPPTAPGT